MSSAHVILIFPHNRSSVPLYSEEEKLNVIKNNNNNQTTITSSITLCCFYDSMLRCPVHFERLSTYLRDIQEGSSKMILNSLFHKNRVT